MFTADTSEELLEFTTKCGGETEANFVCPNKPALKEANLRTLEKDAFVTGVKDSVRQQKRANISVRIVE